MKDIILDFVGAVMIAGMFLIMLIVLPACSVGPTTDETLRSVQCQGQGGPNIGLVPTMKRLPLD
jgi:hypothetical protein